DRTRLDRPAPARTRRDWTGPDRPGPDRTDRPERAVTSPSSAAWTPYPSTAFRAKGAHRAALRFRPSAVVRPVIHEQAARREHRPVPIGHLGLPAEGVRQGELGGVARAIGLSRPGFERPAKTVRRNVGAPQHRNLPTQRM